MFQFIILLSLQYFQWPRGGGKFDFVEFSSFSLRDRLVQLLVIFSKYAPRCDTRYYCYYYYYTKPATVRPISVTVYRTLPLGRVFRYHNIFAEPVTTHRTTAVLLVRAT